MMRRAESIAMFCILLACIAVSRGARQVLQVTNAPISSGVQTGAGSSFNNFSPVGGSSGGTNGGPTVNAGNVTRTTTPASSAAPDEAPAAEAPPSRPQGLITAGDLGASNIYFTPGNGNCVGRGCGRRLD